MGLEEKQEVWASCAKVDLAVAKGVPCFFLVTLWLWGLSCLVTVAAGQDCASTPAVVAFSAAHLVPF